MAKRLFIWICLPSGVLLLATGMVVVGIIVMSVVTPNIVTNRDQVNQGIYSIIAGLALINLCEMSKRVSALERELASSAEFVG